MWMLKSVHIVIYDLRGPRDNGEKAVDGYIKLVIRDSHHSPLASKRVYHPRLHIPPVALLDHVDLSPNVLWWGGVWKSHCASTIMMVDTRACTETNDCLVIQWLRFGRSARASEMPRGLDTSASGTKRHTGRKSSAVYTSSCLSIVQMGTVLMHDRRW